MKGIRQVGTTVLVKDVCVEARTGSAIVEDLGAEGRREKKGKNEQELHSWCGDVGVALFNYRLDFVCSPENCGKKPNMIEGGYRAIRTNKKINPDLAYKVSPRLLTTSFQLDNQGGCDFHRRTSGPYPESGDIIYSGVGCRGEKLKFHTTEIYWKCL